MDGTRAMTAEVSLAGRLPRFGANGVSFLAVAGLQLVPCWSWFWLGSVR